MDDSLCKANSVTQQVKPIRMRRSSTSILRSDSLWPHSGWMTFSVMTAVGASSVPLAVDRMAESSAPKNSTWANSGVRCRISVGSTCWKSFSLESICLTMAGSMSRAETAMNIGMKAISRYSEPPSSVPCRAIFSVRAEVTRWNTSCCATEPSAMVTKAAMKPSQSCSEAPGKNFRRSEACAVATTLSTPPAMPASIQAM